jgi:hypothetical protein
MFGNGSLILPLVMLVGCISMQTQTKSFRSIPVETRQVMRVYLEGQEIALSRGESCDVTAILDKHDRHHLAIHLAVLNRGTMPLLVDPGRISLSTGTLRPLKVYTPDEWLETYTPKAKYMVLAALIGGDQAIQAGNRVFAKRDSAKLELLQKNTLFSGQSTEGIVWADYIPSHDYILTLHIGSESHEISFAHTPISRIPGNEGSSPDHSSPSPVQKEKEEYAWVSSTPKNEPSIGEESGNRLTIEEEVLPGKTRTDIPVSKAISTSVLARLQEICSRLTTIRASELDSSQLLMIAETFQLPADELLSFRWGESMAGKSHPHAGSTWYRIEYGDVAHKTAETIRVASTGEVIERSEE